MRHRLLIAHRGAIYKLLSFEFRDHADGSFYITYDRDLAGRRIAHMGSHIDPSQPLIIPETEKPRVSYHPSGIIRFHGIEADPIFCDPIYRIERDFGIALISVARIEQLSPAIESRDSDIVAPLDDAFSGRMTFRLGIMPNGSEPVPVAFAKIDYASWFALGVSLTKLPTEVPAAYAQSIWTVTPRRGQHESPAATKDEALVAFHRKQSGPQPHICYWEPKQGIGRIIFNQVMVRVPELRIYFGDERLKAEIISASRAEIRFKVTRPSGYLKSEAPPIVGFELDARL